MICACIGAYNTFIIVCGGKDTGGTGLRLYTETAVTISNELPFLCWIACIASYPYCITL